MQPPVLPLRFLENRREQFALLGFRLGTGSVSRPLLPLRGCLHNRLREIPAGSVAVLPLHGSWVSGLVDMRLLPVSPGFPSQNTPLYMRSPSSHGRVVPQRLVVSSSARLTQYTHFPPMRALRKMGKHSVETVPARLLMREAGRMLGLVNSRTTRRLDRRDGVLRRFGRHRSWSGAHGNRLDRLRQC